MTTRKSFRADGTQFAWDATSISAAEKCPRYYQLSILEGWRPHETSVHLKFGQVYASALETYYKLRAEGTDHEQALIFIIRQAMIDTWSYDLDPDGQPIPDSGAPWQSMHSTKTRETLIRTIVWYFEHFADDPCETVTLPDGTAAVEYSFALPVESDLVFCGHIDRLVNYSGGVYVMDQKTTGTTITPKFFADFTPDIQMSMYSWAGSIIFQIPISGVIIDGAQIAAGFSRFERGFAHRSRGLLEEFYESSIETIRRTTDYTLREFFPMNRTACGNYGGCAFRRVCSRSPDVRDNFLRADFYQAPLWDPIERR